MGIALAAGLVCAPTVLAVDTTAPRIVGAAMGDADRDHKADRVFLTYSEPINHPLDTATFPFQVGTYTIVRVNAAQSSRTLVIVLQEKSSTDLSAKPAVTYTRTTEQPVRDVAGNQAIGQTFSATVPLNVDADGDGITAANGDCGPSDPTIYPGAVDRPDLKFVDSNCDGIDGDRTRAVFVARPAAGGSDANPGTKASPKATVNAAIATASSTSPRKDVYVAGGSYDEGWGVQAASNVGLYGGYRAGDWSRSAANETVILGAPNALYATGKTGVVVQLMTLIGSRADETAYGVRAVSGSQLRLVRVHVVAHDGGSGSSGSSPGGRALSAGNGWPGDPGDEDSFWPCAAGYFPQGGAGGTSPVGMTGGKGGAAGEGSDSGYRGADGAGGTPGAPGTPSGKGNWNPPLDYVGADGAAGSPGADGAAGVPVFSTAYGGTNGGSGSTGAPGNGGGGGGGGGGGTAGCNSWGGGGGGGGGGGAGGNPATGGSSAGGSFAVYLYSSSVTVASSVLETGSGGAGGNGGFGQPGGFGGNGGWGGDSLRPNAGNPYGYTDDQDDGSNGGRGGRGGEGGRGGHGGGGAGGPSVGVLLAQSSTATIDAATTFGIGFGGPGGSSAGNPGPNGVSAQTYTAP